MRADPLPPNPLKAPFPWFGGKSRVAGEVWKRFGAVPNYVEPFFGSGAVLLNRPHGPVTETVNDKDCYLVNFWRSLQQDPQATAQWADWPVSEADLLARHRWLLAQQDFRERICEDPEYFDPKIAGWWVWGICAWIGSGWCVQKERVPAQLPHLGDAGRGEQISAYFHALSERLRNVRVACGNWDRILGESITTKHGLTAVFLDPPYGEDEHSVAYSAASNDVAPEVRKWAIANGDNPLLRIALCGYEGEHLMPASWECFAWKTPGGFGSQSNARGRENATRERIWFSPRCLRPQEDLFAALEP